MITLLGLLLIAWSFYRLKSLTRQLEIIRRFKEHGAQSLMITVLQKQTSPQRRRQFFLLDRNLDNVFLCEFKIEGVLCQATLLGYSDTQVGKVYIMTGHYFPNNKLFIPSSINLSFQRRRFFIPYIYPRVLIRKRFL